MYEVGVEAARDIPGLDGASDPSFESWAAFELERPSRDPELCFIALVDGRVVGFASLDVFPDDVFHGLTAVARDWRGRGVGTALKRSQIAAAKERGFRRLLTESQHENEPMRRLNEKLGFRPEPSLSTIVLRGPLAAADCHTIGTIPFHTRTSFIDTLAVGRRMVAPQAARRRIELRLSPAAGR